MKVAIADRVIEATDYIIAHNATIRSTAKHLGVSKSTIHKDISERLIELDKTGERLTLLRGILTENFFQKHLRGGASTKRKYSKKTQSV